MKGLAPLLVFLVACGAAAPPLVFTTTVRAGNPLVGKSWDEQTNAFVTFEHVEKTADATPLVLLGEKHDNPDHHRLQARVLKSIVDHGRRPAVVFEMIDLDLQPAVDAFMASGSTNVDELGNALEWKERGWPDFSLYRPIFEVIVASRLKIVAGGLKHAITSRIVRDGPAAIPPEIAPHVRLLPLEPTLAASLDEEIKGSHCGMLPDAMIAPMSLAQRVKDALMASMMTSSATRDGAVLIAGNGHVRSDRGVPMYLSRSITISFVEVAGETDASAYKQDAPARFVVFTPRVDDKDPCAKFEHPISSPEAGRSQ